MKKKKICGGHGRARAYHAFPSVAKEKYFQGEIASENASFYVRSCATHCTFLRAVPSMLSGTGRKKDFIVATKCWYC